MQDRQGTEWGRELSESIVLIGLLLATVGSTVGLGLMAARVLAG
jgi:hypothetical protein